MHEANDATALNSELICGIVVRLDAANKRSFEQGKITPAQRAEAEQVYTILREASEVNCDTTDLPTD